jgi:hypothetical protein
MAAQPTVHFPFVGGRDELCAGLGAPEEGGSLANVDFPKETGDADATQQTTIKWVGCSISPVCSGMHIVHSHAQKVEDKGGKVELFHTRIQQS